MWSNDPPELRMLIVREYEDRLRRDAIAVRRRRRNESRAEALPRVQGLRLKLGRLLIVVGRTLQDDDLPCPDLARS